MDRPGSSFTSIVFQHQFTTLTICRTGTARATRARIITTTTTTSTHACTITTRHGLFWLKWWHCHNCPSHSCQCCRGPYLFQQIAAFRQFFRSFFYFFVHFNFPFLTLHMFLQLTIFDNKNIVKTSGYFFNYS